MITHISLSFLFCGCCTSDSLALLYLVTGNSASGLPWLGLPPSCSESLFILRVGV